MGNLDLEREGRSAIGVVGEELDGYLRVDIVTDVFHGHVRQIGDLECDIDMSTILTNDL